MGEALWAWILEFVREIELLERDREGAEVFEETGAFLSHTCKIQA
jgi:hypothetical protein